MTGFPELAIEQWKEGKTVVFRLNGWLNDETAVPLVAALKRAEIEAPKALHLYMEDVKFVDSQSLGSLLQWHRQFTDQGVDFRLLDVSSAVSEVLRISNLESLFNIGPAPADTTARRRKTDRALFSSHNFSRQIMAALGEGLVGLNPEGRVAFANPKAEKMLGALEADLLGRPLSHVAELRTFSGAAAEAAERIRAVAQGHSRPYYEEFEIVNRQTKESAPVRLTATPIQGSDGEAAGAVIGLLDISGRKRIEAAARRAAMLEALTSLAGGIAHEFNNLMVGVLGNAELLKFDLEDRPDLCKSIDAISKSAEKAGDLAHQMLAFARTGKTFLTVMNLNEAVEEALEANRELFPPRVEFKRSLAQELWQIRGDECQMRQVAVSLCLNAVEAIAGEGRVEVSTRNVRLGSENTYGLDPGRYVRLAVEDNGCGMGPEVLSKAFEPFFSTKEQRGGLGLAAVYGIVKKLNGATDLQSSKGKGTTAVVLLRAAQSDVPLEELAEENEIE